MYLFTASDKTKHQVAINIIFFCYFSYAVGLLVAHLTIALDKALFFNQKVSIFFLFLNENICCGYSLEAPQRGASNEYPQTYVFVEK